MSSTKTDEVASSLGRGSIFDCIMRWKSTERLLLLLPLLLEGELLPVLLILAYVFEEGFDNVVDFVRGLRGVDRPEKTLRLEVFDDRHRGFSVRHETLPKTLDIVVRSEVE